jgi:hypothetical protein
MAMGDSVLTAGGLLAGFYQSNAHDTLLAMNTEVLKAAGAITHRAIECLDVE